MTVVCAVLTYMAQFVISDFYVRYINFDNTLQLQNVLFVLGFSVTGETSFFRQVYFYYFMIMISIVEKLLLKFVDSLKEEESLQKEPSNLNRR